MYTHLFIFHDPRTRLQCRIFFFVVHSLFVIACVLVPVVHDTLVPVMFVTVTNLKTFENVAENNVAKLYRSICMESNCAKKKIIRGWSFIVHMDGECQYNVYFMISKITS